MSNLSDIGFPTPDDQAVNEMIMHVLELAKPIQTSRGFYLKFSDESGAEIYLQGNFAQELIGFNPHFAGKSRRKVVLRKSIERDSSELDGGFQALADIVDDIIRSDNPYIFDVPDFRTVLIDKFPFWAEIQLTAFGSNDFEIFADEQSYNDSQEIEWKYTTKSFVPSGLSSFDEADASIDLSVVRPIAVFSGGILEFELRTNILSGENFYWFLIDTYGGAVDVVIDPKYVAETPKIGGIVKGTFWLSGKVLV